MLKLNYCKYKTQRSTQLWERQLEALSDYKVHIVTSNLHVDLKCILLLKLKKTKNYKLQFEDYKTI